MSKLSYMALPGVPTKQRIPEIIKVINIVSDVCKITPERIKERSRKRDVVVARQFVIYICRKWHKRTTIELAKYFSLDHTTVMHSTSAMSNWLQTDESVQEKYNQIIEKLNL